VPAVDIGTRQASRERAANCINVSYSHKEIEDAVHYQLRNGRYPANTIYGDGKAGQRIADILADVNISIQKRLMY
jgi:UDP-N-acetylglucosamine 2-epimerase